MREAVESVKKQYKNIIKQGMLDYKILMELKMNTSLYNYLEVLTNYFIDEDDPNLNNWTDVEGMGYGWLWLSHDEDEWHEMMCKMIASRCERLLSKADKVHYIVSTENNKIIYHFIEMEMYRQDTIITLSHEALDF